MRHLTPTTAQTAPLLATLTDIPRPSVAAHAPADLLRRCPEAAETPFCDLPDLAERFGIAALHAKDERNRMGLGSFKALGAAYVIACDAEQGRAKGQAYYTASAGNHGLSVAAGAQAFGARAVIYLAATVPPAFAARLEAMGAEVRWRGDVYEDSMAAAQADAEAEGAVLLSDSSWPGYTERPWRLMEGYLVLMQEAAAQISEPPSHIFLQAGVGGLAASAAAYAREVWGDAPRIIVVEPDAAPALFASVEAGAAQVTEGPASAMGRLDCKEPSLIALKGLARDATDFMLISEEDGANGAEIAAQAGLPSTPSGAAGLAGLCVATSAADHASAFGLDAASRVLVILSEGPEG
ncbi:pyridoxal-phosphate dependent enzyme [Gymnodinialimonas ceratoperidinii]|uniref:Pyridoxal-phosphate dependent enzyme n=1 Tax=Gymnodinialimonas ceratoperidinii TaxID=2856823 RepID=A0A8F6YC16_9RHOB|nr:pyridoxal-phosphate dependent enzyme [Gymnodinialimonas ceratoperidinii]QXT38752.1 pyridoxal-phosphate dependent enzyme [Gymnodinialimonas ceratoperidinii]